MIRLITFFVFFLTLQINCNGQSFFNYTDTVFEVGQIRRIEVTYQLSGGCGPRIESLPILDSIYNFLEMNKNLKIEIGVHTDCRSDSMFNVEISNMRARKVEGYLIEKGIDTNRMEYKGYGENDPKTVDSEINRMYPFLTIGQKLTEEFIKKLDTVEKQEIAHMLNRRTEIKIIEISNRP